MTDTTRTGESNPAARPLLMALELGRRQWTIGFSVGAGAAIRRRTVHAPAWSQLAKEVAAAKERFGVAPEAPVESCYEAGPDGFWVHRYLSTLGVRNRVVDSSSIEVDRRARRAKTDKLDVRKLVTMLAREVQGEPDVWHIVRVPSEADEDRRQPQRELRALKRARTRGINRIGGLLATHGTVAAVRADFGERLAQLRTWCGDPLPPALQARLAREWETLTLLTRQMHEVSRARRAQLRDPSVRDTAALQMVQRLLALRGIGEHGAWLLVTELFAWRGWRNRRQVGALTGLTGTPYRSGTMAHEQGISRAGNAQIRAIAIELAWCWLQYQPESALAQWYQRRWGGGGAHAHKIGIVAVARRLVIALWRYVETGVVPDGAHLKATGRDARAA
jgi:transposase